MKGKRQSVTEWSFRFCAAAVVVISAVVQAPAQDPPVNASLVGTWDGYAGDYADIWGEGNYAYLPNFALGDGMTARVHIIDISNPSSPFLDETFFVPSPNNFSSPQDVKTGDGLLFIGLEGGSPDSVAIVDIRNPNARAQIATVRISGLTAIHNVFYDNKFLYMVDSSTPRVGILDLTLFDPDNPPGSPITQLTWLLQNVGSVFVHDITVRNGRLYAAAWNSGLWVYDVSDVANTMPTFMGSTPGASTHSMWPTDDGNYVVTGEERTNGGITVYEMTESPPGTLAFTLRGGLVLPDDANSVHNQVMVGNRLYISWYQAGLQVFDVNCATGALEFVASFDTSLFANTGGFDGNWGVYPLLGADKVLLSDLEDGFFVVDVARPLEFGCPLGTPDIVDPQSGAEVRVAISSGSADPDPSTGQLFVQVDGGVFQASPLQQDGGDFVGQIGATPCGSAINYYISIDTLQGQTVTNPFDAPASTFSAISAVSIIPVSSFDFENDIGWTVSGDAVDGQWETGVPAGDGARGDPTSDSDGSGRCFLTDNVVDNSDVDGGSTILTSPPFDLSALAFPRISYARWYSNVVGASPQADTFVVEITDNGTDWVNLETVGPAGAEVAGGWFHVTHELPDGVSPSTSVQVRFIASDLGAGSVVEAGIDAFAIEDLECPPQEQIPTVSQWGMMAMGLLLFTVATIVIRRSRRAAVA
ncbi:MAG: hypothetical protein V3W34_02055 [Phycisphaerae bacterium]